MPNTRTSSSILNINNYFGDWLIIKLPVKIILTKYRIYKSYDPKALPSLWKCYGSNDGINFFEISEGSNNTILTETDYNAGYYEKILNTSFQISYQYIGWCINKITSTIQDGSSGIMILSEIELYGKEIISQNAVNPIYISSNILLNNILPQYLTSNQINTNIIPIKLLSAYTLKLILTWYVKNVLKCKC